MSAYATSPEKQMRSDTRSRPLTRNDRLVFVWTQRWSAPTRPSPAHCKQRQTSSLHQSLKGSTRPAIILNVRFARSAAVARRPGFLRGCESVAPRVCRASRRSWSRSSLNPSDVGGGPFVVHCESFDVTGRSRNDAVVGTRSGFQTEVGARSRARVVPRGELGVRRGHGRCKP